MLKNKKGITLVALVVTIVVLLILAGVSINAVVGDDGIIKKAKESANLTKESEAKEIINRAIIEFITTEEYDTLEDFLKTKVSAGTIDSVVNNGDGTLNVSKNGYTVTVENKTNSANGNGGNTGGETQKPEITVNGIKVVADGQETGTALGEASIAMGKTLYITFIHSITGGTTTVKPDIPYAVTKNGTYTFAVTGTVNGKRYTKEVSVTVNQFTDYKIGDYVNYTYDSAGSYSLSSTYSGYSRNQTIAQTTGLKWRILNIDEANGTVDLISENPTGTNVYFQGALGYHNGPYLMNAICESQYSNSTLNVKARNISLLDMEKHLTTPGITARNGDSSAGQYGATKTYTEGNSKYPLLYDGQKGAGVNVAETEVETKMEKIDITKGNDPYKESVETTSPLTDKTYKQASNNVLTVTQTYYNISINKDNYGDAASVLSNPNYYWVSARDVNTGSVYAYFGLRYAKTYTDDGIMFDSHGDSSGTDKRLRPVVSLPSSLLTGEKTNDAWNLSK